METSDMQKEAESKREKRQTKKNQYFFSVAKKIKN